MAAARCAARPVRTRRPRRDRCRQRRTWTNIGPYRSNWIQNGLQVARVRYRPHPHLPRPSHQPDVLYVLTSSGGLWKTTNFSHPRPAWTATTDTILSTSGGNAALGKNPDTIYLGTGDPFDPGVGGYADKSTDGGRHWSAAHQARRVDVIPDVKVDTIGPADVDPDGHERGAVPLDRWRRDLPAPVLSGLIWSLHAHERRLAGRAHRRRRTARSCFSTDKGATWAPIPNAGGVYSGAGRTTLAAAVRRATRSSMRSPRIPAAPRRRICSD